MTNVDIADHAIRSAAIPFECETGRSPGRERGEEREAAIIGIFLFVNGYLPPGSGPGPSVPTLPAA